MAKSSLSKTQSYEEMTEFWDTHSIADFDDETYDVELTIDPSLHDRLNHICLQNYAKLPKRNE